MKKVIKVIVIISIISMFAFVVLIGAIVSAFFTMSAGNNKDGDIAIPITIEAEILANSSVKYKVSYGGMDFKFSGRKNRQTLTGSYSSGKGMIPMQLPSPPADLTKKVIEPCNAITCTTAPSYKIVHSKNSKDDGVYRKYNGNYLVALGSYYSKTMGDKFVIEFQQADGSTKRINAVIGDQKADVHTDEKHQYQKYDHSVVEFITAKGTENKVNETHNKVNSDFGTIKAIYKDDKVDISVHGNIKGDEVTFTGTVNGKKFTATGTLKDGKVIANGFLGGSKLVGKGKFNYPLKNKYRITSPFGIRISPLSNVDLSVHKGVDFGAPFGEDIIASDGGKVVLAKANGGYGNCVIIDHGNNKFTLYGHCSKLVVTEGQSVNQGDKIAEVGSTGNSTGPHLHFEIRLGGNTRNNAVDPAKILGVSNE